MNMKHTTHFLNALRRPLLLGLLLVPFASAALAQPGAARPRRGEGQGQGRGENRLNDPREGGRLARAGEDGPGRRGPASAKRQLSGLWRGLERVERQEPLSQTQAARVVNLVRPWTTRPQMSESAAQTLQTQLAAIMTPAQSELLERRGGRGGRDGGPRGEGGFGGPRGRRGESGPRGEGGFGGAREGRGARGEGRGGGMEPQQRQALRAFMGNMNPFYAPTGYSEWKNLPQPMQERLSRRYRDSRTTLESLSRKARG